VVLIPKWHVFNQVTLNQQDYIVDANTNLIFKGGWEELYERKAGVKVDYYRFPHMNVKGKSFPFNQGMADFVDQMLKWVDLRYFAEIRFSSKNDYKVY
jgi:hypothetical protein